MKHLLEELVSIMQTLRSPQGCPWDREQTHATVRRCMIEEVYEFAETIDDDNPEKMKEELGDILFQIVFHCQLAEEAGHFSISDVIETVGDKMIRRHPHVFGDQAKKLNTPDEVLDQWDTIKKTEKQHQHRTSILDGIPKHLPSLMRAYKAQKKAAKVGFDWEKAEHIVEKIEEELHEVKDALIGHDETHVQEELGDLFFAVSNLARFLHYDPELLSNKGVDKFISRFQKIEEELARSGKKVEECTLEELDKIWNSHKSQTR
ncbi:MAG: nucleoside triphosphate pyrophosphohydrolase [Candidatus Auribacter fodinae]|jgi:tetrapyrrole methylase family protein/MazG family protein|uniref:Nucleoside triphosphate pyrophosphohydrolase n=1 Tax=Candidatus Auribacter fodinae TaxID=2093366 RepID=A0A3A4RAE9_9BACT|nr:MAG: nucleoside triphosphate pyrophosphohydrolase [Candidatus Auribacter fodinae]